MSTDPAEGTIQEKPPTVAIQRWMFGASLAILGTAMAIMLRSGTKEASAANNQPEYVHAMDLKVRHAGETTFSESTKKFGVEVWRDPYNGNLIYISETGSISVVPD